MDEPIFDPVTYALLKSQLKTDEIQNDSEYITGEDLTEALNSIYVAITDVKNYIEARLPKVRIPDVNDMGIENVVIGLVSTSTANTPIVAAGTIWHYASSANYATQLLQFVGTNGIWTRNKTSGTWGDWRRIDA